MTRIRFVDHGDDITREQALERLEREMEALRSIPLDDLPACPDFDPKEAWQGERLFGTDQTTVHADALDVHNITPGGLCFDVDLRSAERGDARIRRLDAIARLKWNRKMRDHKTLFRDWNASRGNWDKVCGLVSVPFGRYPISDITYELLLLASQLGPDQPVSWILAYRVQDAGSWRWQGMSIHASERVAWMHWDEADQTLRNASIMAMDQERNYADGTGWQPGLTVDQVYDPIVLARIADRSWLDDAQ